MIVQNWWCTLFCFIPFHIQKNVFIPMYDWNCVGGVFCYSWRESYFHTSVHVCEKRWQLLCLLSGFFRKKIWKICGSSIRSWQWSIFRITRILWFTVITWHNSYSMNAHCLNGGRCWLSIDIFIEHFPALSSWWISKFSEWYM